MAFSDNNLTIIKISLRMNYRHWMKISKKSMKMHLKKNSEMNSYINYSLYKKVMLQKKIKARYYYFINFSIKKKQRTILQKLSKHSKKQTN